MKISKKQLALPLILAVIFLCAIAFYTNQRAQKLDNSFWGTVKRDFKFAPLDLMVEGPKEFNTDGIYKDYTYGLMFDYPDEIFESNPTQMYDGGLSKTFYVSGEDGYPKYSLYYVVTTLPTPQNTPQVGELESTTVSTKLRDIETNGLKGVVNYMYPSGKGEGSMVWGYSAAWKKGDKSISIALQTSVGKQELDKFKETFDNIINSLQVIATTN